MCDLLMVAFYVWGDCYMGIWFGKKEKTVFVIFSFLMSLAILTKYFALSVIPLLIVYSIVEERKIASRFYFFAYLFLLQFSIRF